MLLLFSSPTFADDKIYEGHYTYGDEVSIFKACGKDKVYWLAASGFVFSDVKVLALASDEPYMPVYLKFRGHEHFEEVDGYQAKYDFQIHVSEVKKFSKKIPVFCK